jgi:leucyl-tRNA synthetase
MEVPVDIPVEELKEKALAIPAVQKFLQQKVIQQVFISPDQKLVNFVVK